MKNKILIISLIFFSFMSFAQTNTQSNAMAAAQNKVKTDNSQANASLQNKKMEDSFLRPLQKRDSILIADQLDYGFVLRNVKAGTILSLPKFSKLGDSLDIVKDWTLDTLKTNKKAHTYDIEAALRITSFNAGKIKLPALSAVLQDGTQSDTLLYKPMTMKVCTIPVDTAKFKINDIKGQIQYPVTFKEILPYILYSLLVIIIIALIIYAIWRYLNRKALIAKKAEPAHIIALRVLEKYRGNKYWQEDKQKIFYSAICDALRTYMTSRYGFGAMEMTSSEIIAELAKCDLPKDLYESMDALFKTSDLVKFAKSKVDDEENAKAIPTAVRFVTETYQMEIDEEAANAEKSQEKSQQKQDKQRTQQGLEQKELSNKSDKK